MKSSTKIVEQHIACPNCPSSDAYCVYEDGHGFCYSCNTLVPKKGGLLEYSYEYLPWRGVTSDTFRFYDVKTKIDKDGKPVAVGFKYPNGAYKVRKFDEKEFYWEGNASKASLFGMDRFANTGHKYVTITEGELDALSLYQVLQSPVVSIHGASSAVRDVTAARKWLSGFERVYLAFDSDAPGRDATDAVARLFDYNKLYVVRLDPRKDANEWLQSPEGDRLRDIWFNAKKYLPESITSSNEDFKRILNEVQSKGVLYPFSSWNEKTFGMRTGESVLITAPEGVGKTELMHTLEYQLLRETDDNIAAIFLEEPKQRHLQAIAGLALKKPVHLPNSGVTSAEVYAALEDTIRVDERLHVYSHFGSDDPDHILDTIRFLVAGRACRWVLLDHITMVVSGLIGEDERKALDYLSTRLEMMVKELDFGLIVVSHVNDEGKTRGSRNISKIADLRIDITRDLTNLDEAIRNTTQAICSKNRFSGRTGPLADIKFDPMTGTYAELDGFAANDNQPQVQELAA